MSKPDFLLVGAPKCGTTAMFSYLSEHPDVYMAKKERHYFGSDLRPPGYEGPHGNDSAWYASFFEAHQHEQRVGEASVWYLYSRRAAEEIHAFNPDMNILIMLRNPVEMMYSLYKMFIWVHDIAPGGVLDPDTFEAMSFEHALKTQDERKDAFQASWHEDYWTGRRELRLFHTDAGMYHAQVQRYLDVFGPERVHCVVYDDFKQDTAGAYQQVLQFLGVDSSFSPTFEVKNANREIRNTRLHKLLFRNRDSFGAIRAISRILLPPPIRKRIYLKAMDWNVKQVKRSPMHPETEQWLQDVFREDVARLSQLLDRDLLSLWMPKQEVMR